MFINDIFESSGDDLFSGPRNEIGKAIRGGWWASAANQCLKSSYQNSLVEKNIIPGIARSEPRGSIAGGSTWYTVRDWYQKFMAPGEWPELIQYVASLKAKGPLNQALIHLINFYADNPQRMNEVYQLIVDKKAVDALVYFLSWPHDDNQQIQRVPEMEPYIMTSPRAAMYYAARVLKSRWPEAEPYIATDKISWSMYAARSIGTNNLTSAGRNTRDEEQYKALSRLPVGHKKRIAEEDDMFFQRPELATREKAFLNTIPIGSARVRRDIKTAWEWEEEYDVQSVDELPYYERLMANSAGKTVPVVNLDKRGYLTVLLAPGAPFTMYVDFFRDVRIDHPAAIDESEEEMFAPSQRAKAQTAIKAVLDSNYNRYQELYNDFDPKNSEEWYQDLGFNLSDYDYLRSELERGGIPAFLNGLDMVSQDIINSIDSELAMNYKVYLNDLEDQYLQLDEDTDEYDDDMFASSDRVSNTQALSKIAAQLSNRYLDYARTATDDETGDLYASESHALERASNAFMHGLRAGFSELEAVEDPTTWEDLGDLCAKQGIDLSELADKSDAGELSESDEDDDLFAQSKNSKLGKLSTDQLRMLYSLSKSDSRAEYASAHKLQMARIDAELTRRGVTGR